MGIPITVVDAFTHQHFAGNPAAVCFPDGHGSDAAWMQSVAKEMNLAETAFLQPRPEGFDLRWFTPAVEVDLCGHATLASAHVLWESGRLAPDAAARFHTRSGWLICQRRGSAIEMDFPATGPNAAEPAPAEVLAALGIKSGDVVFSGKTRFDYLIRIKSGAAVRALKPDFSLLGKAPVRGSIVTAVGDEPGIDFVSRFFAPASGINEDPVTGSAHCALAPYWGKELGKTEMVAYQASPRGGTVRVRPQGDRVFLGGNAITVLRGELAL